MKPIQQYRAMEKDYQTLKNKWIFLKENNGNKDEIKMIGETLYKKALEQITILQHLDR